MKAGFVGLGRMGGAMVQRMLLAGHTVGVYNRTPEKVKPLADAGAQVLGSVREAAAFGDCVFTMLSDDAAVLAVGTGDGGLVASLPKDGVHVCCGTHSISAIQKLKAAHAAVDQSLIAAPMLGRPEVVTAGQAGMLAGGRREAIAALRPLFDAIARRVFEAGDEPEAAAIIKIANNFVLGCAIEALGESSALTRKYGVVPDIFHDVLTEGLFACSAYKVYGKIIAEKRYLPAGQRVMLGLKDSNLALAAAESVGVPLPSANVWRDRLIGCLAHGEGDLDWAAMAREQARASGLE